MSLFSSAGPRLGAVVAVGALGAATLPFVTGPAAANPAGTGLVISEVYGAGGNGTGPTYTNDFIELYNPTGSPVSVDGWSVQYRSQNGSTVGTNITPLSGSVPAHSHYLVVEAAGASAGTVPMPPGDVTGTIAMGGGAGQVLLVNTTTASTVGTGDLAGNSALIDMVGYGAAGSYEAAPTTTALTNVTSAQRTATGVDTDNNDSDFSEATPTPANSGNVSSPLTAANPGNKTGFVGAPITPFALQASGGTTPYSWTATGLPPGVTVAADGTVAGTPTTAGSYSVTATVTDSANPTPATASTTFTFTIDTPGASRTIAEIQGTGDTSPLVGQTVTTRGVVTASYPTGGFNGFTIQTDGTGGGSDATPGASDGLFVFLGSAATSYPAIGDLVDVTGPVSEFNGLTEISPASGGVVPAGSATGVTPLVTAYPKTAAGREAHESELVAPTDTFTVSNNFTTNQFGEIGLSAGVSTLTGHAQLWQPTDWADAQDTGAIDAITADNAARGVVLDDGASTNFLSTSSKATWNIPLPWLTPDNPVRIGSRATLHAPVILDYRNNAWKFQPRSQVTGTGASTATFTDTRGANAAPQAVGGDLKLATFNVLNFFPTTGREWVALGGGRTCTYFTDRANDPVGDNSCTGGTNGGPRGAAESSGGTDLTAATADLERQRTKIVQAINTLGADVVSLEELENSVTMGKDRDDAIAKLVTALNAAAGSTRWAYVPSPPASELPSLAEQDVIRTGFIYNPSTISPVGASKVLVGSAPFGNAREPLAQAFKARGAADAAAFVVVVNHFKSKGDSNPPATGDNANGLQGAFNGDRTRQAQALLPFASSFAASRGTNRIFLAGDFNSYTKEDPLQVLEAGGYTNIESAQKDDTSYEFGGMAGSLDHVLASPEALKMVTKADVWQINAEESVGFEYSRYNYNATLLYQAGNVFRASDHNPEVVGLTAPTAPTPTPTPTTPPPSQVASTLSVTPDRTRLQVGKGKATLAVTVTKADGSTPTGAVTAYVAGRAVSASTVLYGGKADVVVGPFAKLGKVTVEVRYTGDTTTKAGTGTAALTVVKQKPRLKVRVKGAAAKTLVVKVRATEVKVKGKVRVRFHDVRYVARLKHGRAVVHLGRVGTAGSAKVTYLGSKKLTKVRRTVLVRAAR